MSLFLVAATALSLAAAPTGSQVGTVDLVAGSAPTTLKYEGALNDVLEKIAEHGGLNVVIVGDLNEPARVHLTSVTPEEALSSVAKIYDLDVQKQGKLWVIRKHAGAPTVATAPTLPVPPVPGVVPVPPLPPSPKSADAIEFKDALKAKLKDELKEQAKSIKEQAEDALDAKEDAEDARQEAEEAQQEAEEARQEAEAARTEALQKAELARAQAEKVRAQAEKVRAKAHALMLHSGPDRASAGGNLEIEAGTTVDSAAAYGGNVVVHEGARVTDDVVAFGGNVVLEDNARV